MPVKKRKSTRRTRRKSTRRRTQRKSARRTQRKSARRRRSARRKSSSLCDRCQERLSAKIATNIKEGIYASQKQAIAVAYSQVRKDQAECKRCFRR